VDWPLDGVPGESADRSRQAESNDHSTCIILRRIPTHRPHRGNAFYTM